MKEKYILGLCGPSGSGKGYIYDTLVDLGYKIKKIVSYTTRKPRKGERDGIDYFFVTPGEMKQKIKQGFFAESEEVYEDCFYGTPKDQLKLAWDNDELPVLDIDYKGMVRIKELAEEERDFSLTAFGVFPETSDQGLDFYKNTLRDRLKKRDTETEQDIGKRVNRSIAEIVEMRVRNFFIPLVNKKGEVNDEGVPVFVETLLKHAPFLKEYKISDENRENAIKMK